MIGEMVTEEQMGAMSEPGAEPPKADRAPRKPVAPPKKPRPKTVGMPNDAVADLLTRVRNAAGARHETVTVPVSRMRVEIARILRDEGFISGYEQQNERELVLRMKFVGKLPAVCRSLSRRAAVIPISSRNRQSTPWNANTKNLSSSATTFCPCSPLMRPIRMPPKRRTSPGLRNTSCRSLPE